MESFEILIRHETFKIIPANPENFHFSVFNHATYHIINKNEFGEWITVEHRFGTESIPINEIGKEIDKLSSAWPVKITEVPDAEI